MNNDAFDKFSRELEQINQATGGHLLSAPAPNGNGNGITVRDQLADDVLDEYKAAAKAIEELGIDVRCRVDALTAALRECDVDMKLLKETAAAIKEKGKHASAEVERSAAVSREIRELIDVVKTRLT